MIFEGTEGLPAQISRELQNRQFSLTLSEQFTGGLLALQLSRAGAPLLACEVVPSQEETLGANCALDYRTAGQPFLPGWHWLFRVSRTSISTLR